jgi:hypothetical protein
MQLLVVYRAGDSEAWDLSCSLEESLTKVKPVAAPLGGGKPAPRIPREVTVVVLFGPRGLRTAPGAPSFFSDPADPVRQTLERIWQTGNRDIVPVLIDTEVAVWLGACEDLPEPMSKLGRFDIKEITPKYHDEGVKRLVNDLEAGRGPSFDDALPRTAINVKTPAGGALTWWELRNSALRLIIDGDDVGAVAARKGTQDVEVGPGTHTVQVRFDGRMARKSAPMQVQIAEGETLQLICNVNAFTNGLALEASPG